MTTGKPTIPPPDRTSALIVLVVIILLLVIGGLCSCNTPAGLLRKHDKIQMKSKRHKRTDTVGAHWCLVNYPLRTRYLPGNTIYKQGKEVVKEIPGPTVYVDCDSAEAAGADTKKVGVPCPPTEIRYQVDTVYRHDTEQTIDTRELELCEARYVGAMDLASKFKQKFEAREAKIGTLNKALWVAGILIALLVALIIIRHKIKNPLL